MPHGSSIVVFITRSITGHRIHPALSHSCVDSEGYRQISIVDNSAADILIETLDDIYNLLMNYYSIQYALNHCSVHHVKRRLQGNKTDMQP